MKNRLVTFLALASLFAANAMSQTFLVDTMRLNHAYRELMDKPASRERQEAFFRAFPNTWQEFYSLYQYVYADGYDLTMYHLAPEHITALQDRMRDINDTTYCTKLVNIAIGAAYEADAPNYYRSLLHRVMRKRMDAFLYVISRLRKGYQMQFWQFYWSFCTSDPDEKREYRRLYKLNADKYPGQMEIMSIAFKYFHDGVNIDGGYLDAD